MHLSKQKFHFSFVVAKQLHYYSKSREFFFPHKIAVKNSIDYFHPWKIQVLAKNEGLLVRLTALFTVENALSFEGTV